MVPRILLAGFTFCQLFLIAATIKYDKEPLAPENKRYGQAVVDAHAIFYLGLASSGDLYYRYQASRLATVTRSGLITMILEQTLALRRSQLQAGDAIILMGTDTEQIMVSMHTVHELWASLASVGLAVWLLEIQVYIACVVPAVMALGCILATTPLSSRCAAAQREWVGHVQERLTVTAAMLGDVKAVKMLRLERVLCRIVSDYRQSEFSISREFCMMMTGVVMLCMW
jgi:ATP-binding cassette subfamily C (CFTR/MRP) protein 1